MNPEHKNKFPFRNGKNNTMHFQQNKKWGPSNNHYKWEKPTLPESNYFEDVSWSEMEQIKKNNVHSQNHYSNANHNQPSFNSSSPLLSDPRNGPEETPLLGPGSASDRMEKVLATKKRIEEALASKSAKVNSTEITLPESSTTKDTSKDKDVDKNIPVTNLNNDGLDLKLTNNDFKEIGSVGNSALVEVEPDDTPIAPCSSQKRSFENVPPPPPTLRANENNANKSQRIGSWNFSAINEIVTLDNFMPHSKDRTSFKTSRSRGDSNIYIKDTREKILGNIEPLNKDHNQSSNICSTTSLPNQRSGFEKIGRLYQSFLKSRLSGYTLKTTEKSKNKGLNPLLDKSVLENQRQTEDDTAAQDDREIELEMPRPIMIKVDNCESECEELVPDIAAVEEAHEFCQEFSYLLKLPNYLIPQESLEKLGLGHLCEINKLINEKGSAIESHESSSTSHNNLSRGISNYNPLNSIPDNDIILNQGVVNSIPAALNLNNIDQSVLNTNSNQSSNSLSSAVPKNTVNMQQNVLVNAVVEKVLEQLTQTSNDSSQNLNASITEVLRKLSQPNQYEPSAGHSPNVGPSTSEEPEQMKNISSKILKLFLIDKQIEGLMAEKMKLYNELLSVHNVSSSLCKSWTQDQIQPGKSMNFAPDVVNIMSSHTRLLQPQVPGLNVANIDLYNNSSNAYNFEETMLSKPNGVYFNNPPNQMPPAMSENIESMSVCSVTEDTSTEPNRPKLSVRKDLIDPNVNRNLIKNDFIPPVVKVSNPGSNKIKKKKLKVNDQSNPVKKKRKVDAIECVNLIEDTTDEEIIAVLDDVSPAGTKTKCKASPQDKITAEPTQKKVSVVYNLDGDCVTRINVLKKALIVGCKSGYLRVFNIVTASNESLCKAHSEAIMCLHVISKNVISGSADSTISVFSLSTKSVIQSINVIAPIQCCDVQFFKAYFGTKNGHLVVYKLQMVEGVISLELDHQPLKLTNCSVLAIRVAEEGSPGLRVVILASRGEQITVRDASNGNVLRTFDWCDTVHCIELFGTYPLVYCGTNTKSVKVMNFVTGENKSDCHLGRAIIQIAFLGSIMFAASFDGKVYVYDVEDKKKICTMQVAQGAGQGLIQGIVVHKLKIIVACNQNELKAICFPKELKKYLKTKNSNFCGSSDVTS